MSRLHLQRLGYALGARVTGVDLRQAVDDETVEEIRQAWLEHMVLCFRDQNLSKEQLIAFTARFTDDVEDHSGKKTCDPENKNIFLATNQPIAGRPWDGYKNGQSWHSDQSFTERPSIGAFLLAKKIPHVGGDTLFANQYIAYDALSPAMREIVDGLSAVHDASMLKGFEVQAPEIVAAYRRQYPPVIRPVAMVHPETGRKVLYIGDRVRQLVGLTPEESRPLLDFLVRHATQYEFTYRHRWSENDLLMWDNRCLLHLALTDYDQDNQPRHMWRCSFRGPKSGRLESDEIAMDARATSDGDGGALITGSPQNGGRF